MTPPEALAACLAIARERQATCLAMADLLDRDGLRTRADAERRAAVEAQTIAGLILALPDTPVG